MDRPCSSNDTGGHAAARIAGWLGLAAAPVFAAMAAFSVLSAGMADMCPAPAMSPFTGMAAMYLLMGVFHLSPWLKRIGRRR